MAAVSTETLTEALTRLGHDRAQFSDEDRTWHWLHVTGQLGTRCCTNAAQEHCRHCDEEFQK